MARLPPALLSIPLLALAACTNPYDPGQRALGGAALGAGAGALIGSASGNAGAGALIGGALGGVTGAVTTPQPHYQPAPQTYRGQPAYREGWYDRSGRWHPGPPPRRGYYRY